MKLMVDVPKEKADSVMKMLRSVKGVKTSQVKSNGKRKHKKTEKEKILAGLKRSVHQVNLHKQGKIKLKTLDEVLKELRNDL